MIALATRFRLIALALCAWATPAAACTVASPATASLGSPSPNAIKALAVAPVERASGINCSNSVITLQSGNVFTATISNANSFKLTLSGQPDGAFQVLPTAASTTPMASGVATSFLSADIVGLLGGSPSSIPVFIKPISTALLTPGTYTGAFRISWAWKFCSGVWVGSTCTLGTVDQGSGFADIVFTVAVTPKPVTVAISSVTTWDPISTTAFPKAIIGSKKRMTVVVANPDIVATDLNSVRVEIPTQAKTAIALEGDGASIGAPIKFTDGFPSSTLTFSYTNAGDGADDVDFYADGTGWAYVPTPGDPVSQALVTKLRLKPRGKLAAGSSFTVTLPYLVK